MSNAIIELKRVSLEYRSRAGLFKRFTHKALDEVSFTVKRGEVFGVLGRNGSGKSTLLQVLAGVFKPDSGEVLVSPNVTRSLLTLGLGFNMQLSGRDNALISCMFNGYTKRDAKSKLEQIKDFAELEDFFEQPVKTYSAGMRARLGFATGLLLNVDILLIDEVLSVGDQNFKKKAEAALLSKMSGDQTVIFVSHSAAQVKKLCERCVWLQAGKIVDAGSTAEVMKEYQKQGKKYES
ncbi:teichoic acid export ATP-binding protein TagH [Pseudoalteromonas sp. SW0106-04]|uniref:ABC transporter ATP-binding protein n=1 Tax=Pseudoalteromonas sp. SW0106-04 TaxID=1702169 RepID=UPI0006B4B196|nr:ABC transporter ATP-binding protein [Pseudoalteromonas sp. SW0106-04]GAP74594.1 teichoic acid export ATP-binding protein TagH [Pseudoalteromonas sp. SW0106-04]